MSGTWNRRHCSPTIHDLRHTAGTMLLAASVDPTPTCRPRSGSTPNQRRAYTWWQGLSGSLFVVPPPDFRLTHRQATAPRRPVHRRAHRRPDQTAEGLNVQPKCQCRVKYWRARNADKSGLWHCSCMERPNSERCHCWYCRCEREFVAERNRELAHISITVQ